MYEIVLIARVITRLCTAFVLLAWSMVVGGARLTYGLLRWTALLADMAVAQHRRLRARHTNRRDEEDT